MRERAEMWRGIAVGLVSIAVACGGCGSSGGGATGGSSGAVGGKGGGAGGKGGGAGGAGGLAGAGGSAGSSAAGSGGAGGHAGTGGAAGSAGAVGGAGAGGASGSSGAAGSGGAGGKGGVGGSAGAAGGGGAGGAAGPVCIGTKALDLISWSDLSSGIPLWTDKSTACGTATFEDNGLTLTRDGTCTADQQGGFIQLDPTRWQLCGDFDMTVDFDLTQFSVPPGGSRWLAWHAYDPASDSNGIALERYNVGFGGCYPSTLTYKSWTSSSTDCSGAIFRSTTDVTGTMRVTRVGSTVTSYTKVNGDGGVADAGANGWSSFVTSASVTTTPWTMVFYTGVYNGDGTVGSVTLSNLHIKSASTP